MRKWLAIVALIGYSGACYAQQPDALDRIIARYDACFHKSTGSQFLAKLDAEANEVAERAFLACSTEEQTVFSYLTLGGSSPALARSAILKHRNALKRKIVG